MSPYVMNEATKNKRRENIMGCDTSIIKDYDHGEVLLEKLTKWGGRKPSKLLPSELTGKQVKNWFLREWESYGLVSERFWNFDKTHNYFGDWKMPSTGDGHDGHLGEGVSEFLGIIGKQLDGMDMRRIGGKGK